MILLCLSCHVRGQVVEEPLKEYYFDMGCNIPGLGKDAGCDQDPWLQNLSPGYDGVHVHTKVGVRKWSSLTF